MITLNAYEMISRVRTKVHDRSANVWSDTDILAQIDESCRTLWDMIRMSGEDHNLDHDDVAVGSFTPVDDEIVEYQLPYYMGDPQMLEGVISGVRGSYAIVRAGLEDKDLGRIGPSAPRWFYSQGQSIPTIQIRGNIQSVNLIRIWYVRVYAPSALLVGTAGGTTTSLTVSSATGSFKARDGLYRGMELEVYQDGSASNVGQVVRVGAQVGSVLSGFSPALPAATGAATRMATILPIGASGGSFLTELAAYNLLLDSGNDEEVQLRGPKVTEQRRLFEQGLRKRSSGEPRRIFSSRVQ